VIRVVIAEDQAMVLGALAALLELEPDIDVIGQAADGDEALALVRQLRPDVLVTDIEMPGLTGLEVAASLNDATATQAATPGNAHGPARPKVIVLTTFARSGYLKRALDAGATGYLLKEAPASQLAGAIRTVAAGGRAIDPELALEAWGESDPLTDRERQVLRAAAQGVNTATIAERLGLSDGTVRNYLSEAIGKLGASNRIEAARIARERGWL